MGAQLQHKHLSMWANGTMKLGNSGTYHIENTLSYALECLWSVALCQDANEIIPNPLSFTSSTDSCHLLQLVNNKEDKPPVLVFSTEQVNLLRFDSQVVQSSSSSQCSSQRLLECLLLGIV